MKYVLTIITLIASTSCVQKKLNEHLLEHSKTQKSTQINLADSLNDSQTTPISWHQALQRIETSNIRVQRSKDQVNRVRRQKKQQWLSLAPRIFTFANISSSISELADISTNDISSSITTSLNIPNPFRFHAQSYAYALDVLRAEYQHEILLRETQAELYGLYITQDNKQQRIAELRTLKKNLESTPIESIVSYISSIKGMERTIENQALQLKVRLNRLLNTPGKNWKITGSPPKISYANKLNQISFRKNYAKLALMLQTLQIESNNLSIWNIKFTRLPQLSLGASTPPLYSSQSDSTLSSDQINLFSGLSKSFDPTDPLDKETVKNTKKRIRYNRQQLLLSTESDALRLNLLKKRYKQLLTQRVSLKTQLLTLDSLQTSTSSTSIIKLLEERKKIVDAISETHKRQVSLDLQIWVWDENYWKKY